MPVFCIECREYDVLGDVNGGRVAPRRDPPGVCVNAHHEKSQVRRCSCPIPVHILHFDVLKYVYEVSLAVGWHVEVHSDNRLVIEYLSLIHCG